MDLILCFVDCFSSFQPAFVVALMPFIFYGCALPILVCSVRASLCVCSFSLFAYIAFDHSRSFYYFTLRSAGFMIFILRSLIFFFFYDFDLLLVFSSLILCVCFFFSLFWFVSLFDAYDTLYLYS